MEREVNRKADEILNEYVTKKYKEAVAKVGEVGEYCDIGKLVELVNEVNSWSRFVAGEETDLYEEFKLHVYWQDGQAYILRGKELNE